MNKEFGDDLGAVDKEKLKKDKERNRRLRRENSAFVAGVRCKHNGKADGYPVIRNCQMCSGQHSIWQCEWFKQLSVPERKKLAADKALCFKCLGTGHYARVCPKKHFRCKVPSCGKEHHTLLHVAEKTCDEKERSAGEDIVESKVVAATGAGESRVCLGVIPGEGESEEWYRDCSNIHFC